MLSTLTSKTNFHRPVWVSADNLNVSLDVLGAPLASPVRRLAAISIDLLIVAILSGLDGFWLAAALVVFLYQMRVKDRSQSSWLRNAWVWGVCALFLWLAAERGWDVWTERHAAPASVASRSANSPATAASAPPDASDAAAKEKNMSSVQSDSDRIAALEEALAEARQPEVFRWQSSLMTWWKDTGVGFGWAIVYFSLIPTWLKGQSLGKKLLGLRVVELTGKPLTVRICFSRYGGYAAGMATGMFGFAQILWDANRQSIQDKVAHTVVLDLRAPYRAAEVNADAPLVLPECESKVTSQIMP